MQGCVRALVVPGWVDFVPNTKQPLRLDPSRLDDAVFMVEHVVNQSLASRSCCRAGSQVLEQADLRWATTPACVLTLGDAWSLDSGMVRTGVSTFLDYALRRLRGQSLFVKGDPHFYFNGDLRDAHA